MLRRAINELSVKVQIQGASPLLVKDGRFNDEVKQRWVPDRRQREGVPSAVPISRATIENLRGVVTGPDPAVAARSLPFYLPGASVRGAWRSHLEKVLRSLDTEPRVCDPLIQKEEEGKPAGPYEACSSVLVNKKDERVDFPYSNSCPVCRLFGNTAQASRLSFADAECQAATPILVDNIAISRQTGAVWAPFKAMALKDAKFTLCLRLRNFELWHLGLLGHLFDDLQQGLVPLGSGKNKGWGLNTAAAVSIRLTYFGQDRAADGRLQGLGEILDDECRKRYGVLPPSELNGIQTTLDAAESALWRHVRQVRFIDEFWRLVKPCFNLDAWESFPVLAARKRPAETADAVQN